jgi:hypothetical protein
MKPVTMSLELARQMYESGNEEMKAFAIENYPELDKSQLPKSWDELKDKRGWYAGNCGVVAVKSMIDYNNCHLDFETAEQAQATIAFAKLSRLREIYRQGWTPDWTDGELKSCIVFYYDKIETASMSSTNHFLSFQDSDTTKLFLENFRDLIEQAKPLMS